MPGAVDGLPIALEAAGLVAWDWDFATDRVAWTGPVHALLGLPPDAPPPDYGDMVRLTLPEDRPEVDRRLAAARRGDGPFAAEFRIQLGNGGVRWLAGRGNVQRDAGGRAIGMVGVNFDITDQRVTELKFRDSQDHLRHLMELLPQVTWTTDAQGGFIDLSPRWTDWTGMSAEDTFAHKWVEIVHPDDRPVLEGAWAHALASGEPLDCEARIRMVDGAYRWIRSRAFPLRDRDGAVVRWYAMTEDVDARHRAEARLRAREEHLRLTQEAGGIVAWEWNLTTGTLIWSGPVHSLFGLPRDAAPPDMDQVSRMTREEDRAAIRDACDAAIRSGVSYEAEFRILRADGVERWIAAKGEVVRDAAGVAVRLIGVNYDVTGRRAAEDARIESARKLQNLANVVPSFVWFAEPEGGISFLNDRWYAFTGLTPAQSLPDGWIDAVHPDDVARTAEAWAEARRLEASYAIEVRFRRHDGEYRWYVARAEPQRDDAGRVTAWFGTSTDIHDLKMAEGALRSMNADLERRVEDGAAKLVQLQKLESLGRLTGGIAHDFNNLLNAILMSLNVVRRRLPDAETTVAQLLRNAILGAERGAALTQRMLAFARRQELEPRPVDVAALVDGMSDMLARTIGPRIAIDCRLEPGVRPALVDPNQLELAILNLALNARDAMPDGGTLTISVADDPAGDHVVIRLTDTGCGMDAATLRRAVEPFFTTKGVGKGTGLGLPMVQGFAEQSGGGFSLDSVPGRGTTAEMRFPVAATADPTAVERSDPTCGGQGGLSILLVDDDGLVLMGTTAMLQDLGHLPLPVGSGREALDALANGHRPDVLVTDQVMPGMTGVELAAAVRRLRPELPIVLATGYAELPEGSHDLFAVRLAKPFSQESLSNALARAAEHGGAADRLQAAG